MTTETMDLNGPVPMMRPPGTRADDEQLVQPALPKIGLTQAQRNIDERIRQMKRTLMWYSENLSLVRLSSIVDLATLPGVDDGVYIMNVNTKALVSLDRLTQASAIPVRHELPIAEVDLPSMLVYYHRGNEHLQVISRVMESADHSIRVCYPLHGDRTLPIILASATVNNSHFNELDAGNVVEVDCSATKMGNFGYRSSRELCFEVHTALNLRNDPIDMKMCNHLMCNVGGCDDDNDEHPYNRRKSLHAYAEAQVDKLAAEGSGEMRVGMVLCRWDDSTLRYTDTVVQILNRDAFNRAVHHLIMCTNEGNFMVLLRAIIELLDGTDVVVNGTSLRYEKRLALGANGGDLGYVNGHRIAKPDLEEVLNHVVCCPGRQGEYDDFVSTVSKVSMKFHRAVANGLTVKFRTDTVPPRLRAAAANGEARPEIRVPGRGDHQHNGYDEDKLEFVAPVRKSAGSRAEIMLFGQWRKIRDIDLLMKVLRHSEWSAPTYDLRSKLKVKLAEISEVDVPAEEPAPAATEEAEQPQEAPRYVLGGDGILRLSEPPPPTPEEKAKRKLVEAQTLVERRKNKLRSEAMKVEFGEADTKFVSRLVELDYCLMPESQIVMNGATIMVMDGDHYRDRQTKALLRNQRVREWLTGLQTQLATLTRDCGDQFYNKLAKSRELLETIMRQEHATEHQRPDGDWEYRVTGQSGTQYVIEESTAGVSANGHHICIVPATSKAGADYVGYDYIASLISALAHDRRTARDISTLKSVIAQRENAA